MTDRSQVSLGWLRRMVELAANHKCTRREAVSSTYFESNTGESTPFAINNGGRCGLLSPTKPEEVSDEVSGGTSCVSFSRGKIRFRMMALQTPLCGKGVRPKEVKEERNVKTTEE